MRSFGLDRGLSGLVVQSAVEPDSNRSPGPPGRTDMGKVSPRPLAEPPDVPPRYSHQSLPPYRHVPGLTPHPVTDPRGHLYGVEESQPAGSCRNLPTQWRQCGDYLYGVDLFNRAFLWEAHEAWEWVWITAGKTTEPARFVQGLIQVAAALLRRHLGTPQGAQNLLTKAWRRLDSVEGCPPVSERQAYMGISVTVWRRSVEEFLTAGGGPYPFLNLEG